jgi:hypothetical protein
VRAILVKFTKFVLEMHSRERVSEVLDDLVVVLLRIFPLNRLHFGSTIPPYRPRSLHLKVEVFKVIDLVAPIVVEKGITRVG